MVWRSHQGTVRVQSGRAQDPGLLGISKRPDTEWGWKQGSGWELGSVVQRFLLPCTNGPSCPSPTLIENGVTFWGLCTAQEGVMPWQNWRLKWKSVYWEMKPLVPVLTGSSDAGSQAFNPSQEIGGFFPVNWPKRKDLNTTFSITPMKKLACRHIILK